MWVHGFYKVIKFSTLHSEANPGEWLSPRKKTPSYKEAVTSFSFDDRSKEHFQWLSLVDANQISTKLELSWGLGGDPFGAFSDLHGEDCHNTDVGVLIELHRDQTISLGVPECAGGGGDCGSIVLLDDASDYILEFLLQFGEIFDARLNNLLRPLVNSFALILNVLWTDHIVHGVFSNFLNSLRIKFVLVLKVGHTFFCIFKLFIRHFPNKT